jgi:hypothetical protein
LTTADSLSHDRHRPERRPYWVERTSDHPQVVRLRPLTGSEEDATGLFWPLEYELVESSHFAPPDPTMAGDSKQHRFRLRHPPA